jgi:hypothetical protein
VADILAAEAVVQRPLIAADHQRLSMTGDHDTFSGGVRISRCQGLLRTFFQPLSTALLDGLDSLFLAV